MRADRGRSELFAPLAPGRGCGILSGMKLVTPAIAFFSALCLRAGEPTLEQAKSDFAVADRALNSAYAKARAALPEALFAELQQEQREWIAYRDERAAQAAHFDGAAAEGREKATPEYWSTLASLSAERARIVSGWVKADDFGKPWEGLWLDGYGGRLAILERDGGSLLFSLEVVRGPTYHLGEIGGEASWNGATARFRTESMKDEGEAWITLLKRGHKIEVVAENADAYHGARAWFDGHYVRVSELGREDRERVLAPREP